MTLKWVQVRSDTRYEAIIAVCSLPLGPEKTALLRALVELLQIDAKPPMIARASSDLPDQ